MTATRLILPGPNEINQPNESRGLKKETRATTEDDDILLGYEGNTLVVSCKAFPSHPLHAQKITQLSRIWVVKPALSVVQPSPIQGWSLAMVAFGGCEEEDEALIPVLVCEERLRDGEGFMCVS